MRPLISVIVNCHNGEKYLKKSISSILKQKYKNYEIIFFDNKSNDKSKKIIKSFNNKKIRYFYSNKKLPLYSARNEAIKKSKGQLITFLDTDDWWEDNYLSSREKVFLDKKYDYFYCNANIFYEKKNVKKIYKKRVLPEGKIFNFLAEDYFIMISGVIIKKKIFTKEGFFEKKYNIIGDYDFIMRISKTYNAHSTNLPLLNYRVHDSNFSKLNLKMLYDEFKWWFTKNNNSFNIQFKKNINFFKNKLSYHHIRYLLKHKNKNFFVLKKIINHKNFKEKIKLFIVFLLPKILFEHIQK
jgi:glycosyltransferase involved in cell wall biosynthesis